LGEVLKRYIASRPAGERVAVLAAGGLSHWVGYDGRGINEAFDQALLDDFAQGRAKDWAKKSPSEIEEEAGNGGLEICNWLMAIAAVGAEPDGFRFYEPMPEWLTGMGGMMLKEDVAA
jgi:protocatechuate 4,5-dioxygenase beta chain/2'-aminobiphenyl-2,3-diol 1,2-dioxygenase large subunit